MSTFGSIQTDFSGLKVMAKEFFELAVTATAEQLDGGLKCFGIAYMNCTFSDDFLGRIQKDAEAPALWRIVNNEYMKRRFPASGAAGAFETRNRFVFKKGPQ
jgi:hypothetical protein